MIGRYRGRGRDGLFRGERYGLCSSYKFILNKLGFISFSHLGEKSIDPYNLERSPIFTEACNLENQHCILIMKMWLGVFESNNMEWYEICHSQIKSHGKQTKNGQCFCLLCLENSTCFIRSNNTSSLMNSFPESLVIDYPELLGNYVFSISARFSRFTVCPLHWARSFFRARLSSCGL